ncbi:hypothetical protein H7J07_02880 [Mycobacterium koreense]|uniref:Uncharacterized protein n=1 Tax=Mycolicibacillus koreensis TaxID=1069220 RepID=A0A7I7SGG3_9MYCO|nr:hypothetical protein [Mycolicibacillus koreensis]MCV7247202.1 hypothetical protein [Mycolicibacillus koreensis]ODR09803.1 hypothetical protein BHQ15_05750 [Mycolicibacillus koreensis]OSC33132.1 hypothetical protein B8W67_12165 [Mycolicibacillus koreensis]BBY55843.1 hypothetical protein MKOR_30940 [Mycolicibacillus koreensis]
MLIATVVCCVAALLVAARGVWTLTRPDTGDPVQRVLRAVAPTQLAAASMLAMAGVTAAVAPTGTAVAALVVGVLGAAGTVAAGIWHSARYAAAAEARQQADGCAGACSACTQPCH